MPNLKDLRVRIASVKSTQKITAAMKMVAAAKLRRAREQAEAARPYAERMERMLSSLAVASAGSEGAPELLAGNGRDQVHLLVVGTADRGPCGGFNSGIVRGVRRRVAALRRERRFVEEVPPLDRDLGHELTELLQVDGRTLCPARYEVCIDQLHARGHVTGLQCYHAFELSGAAAGGAGARRVRVERRQDVECLHVAGVRDQRRLELGPRFHVALLRPENLDKDQSHVGIRWQQFDRPPDLGLRFREAPLSQIR